MVRGGVREPRPERVAIAFHRLPILDRSITIPSLQEFSAFQPNAVFSIFCAGVTRSNRSTQHTPSPSVKNPATRRKLAQPLGDPVPVSRTAMLASKWRANFEGDRLFNLRLPC